MKVNELAEAMDLKPLALSDGEREIDGCYVGDLLSWVMGRAKSGNVWVTIMSNVNIVAVATLADVACVVLAVGVTVGEDVTAVAKAKGVNLFTTDLTAYEIAAKVAALTA